MSDDTTLRRWLSGALFGALSVALAMAVVAVVAVGAGVSVRAQDLPPEVTSDI